MAKENMAVDMHEDGEHLWINGKQFISLSRFAKARSTDAEELHLANMKIHELTEENNALKVLLKNKLNETD